MTALTATFLSIATLMPQEAPPANAAELYRQAFTAWEAMDAEDRESIANAFGDPQTLVAADPATTSALERAGRAIGLFMQASRVDGCDWGLDRSEGFALLLPHLGPMRAISRATALSAVRDFAEGRSGVAIASLEAVSRSTRHLTADPVLVDSLVGGAVLGLSSAAIESAIEAGAVDAATAARLVQVLPENVVEAIGPAAALRTEQEVFSLEIGRIRAGEETIADEFLDSEAEGAVASLRAADQEPFDAAMAKVGGFGDRAVAAMADPDGVSRLAALEAIDADIEALRAADPDVAGALLSLVPSYAALGQTIARIEDRVLAVRTRLDAIAAGADPAAFTNGAINYLRAAAFLAQTPPRLQVAFELLRQAPEAADGVMRREAEAWLDRIDEAVFERLRRAGLAERCDFDFGLGGDIAAGDVLMREAFPSLRAGARLLLVEARRRLAQAAALRSGDEADHLEAAAVEEEAIGDLVAVVAMARHLAGDATLGGTLVSASILRDLAGSVSSLRSDGLLASEKIEALRSATASLPRGEGDGLLGADAARRRAERIALRGSSADRVASFEAALFGLAIASVGPEGLAAIADEPLGGADDLLDLEAWARLAERRQAWQREARERIDRVIRVGEVTIDEAGEPMRPVLAADLAAIAVEALAAIDDAITSGASSR